MKLTHTLSMIDPKEHWESKATKLKKERRFEEAVEFLDKAKEIEIDQKAENFWFKKAVHFCEIGEFEHAKDALFKDLEINKKSYESFFLLGKILFELNLFEEALEYFNKASEIHDSSMLKNVQKIDQMKKVNKFEEAVKYSDKVKQEKDIDHAFWFYKGMVFSRLKKYDDAISCFSLSLEKNSNNTKILYELAKVELFSGNKEKCFEILKNICSMEPVNREKLRLDQDFASVSNDKEFRIITDPINT